jgi:hypothetical protein
LVWYDFQSWIYGISGGLWCKWAAAAKVNNKKKNTEEPTQLKRMVGFCFIEKLHIEDVLVGYGKIGFFLSKCYNFK